MVQQSLDFYPWLTSDEFTARRVLIQRLNDNFAELATTLSISITPYVLNNLRMYPEDEWNLEVIKWANEQMSLLSAAAGITHVPIPVSVLTLETRDLFRHFHLEMEPKITEAYVAAFADKVPAAFSFTDVTDADLDTQYESDAIVVSGIDAAAALTITGGQYQIDGGAWASSPTTVVNGASIKVRATSSAEFDTAVDVVLTIGGVSDTFTILSVGEGGGGGAEPDIVIDFKNGVYTLDGSTVTVTDIWHQEAHGDPDGWPFNPSLIVPGSGFPVATNQSNSVDAQFPRLVDALAASLGATGYTVRVTLVVAGNPDGDGHGSLFDWETYDENFNSNVFCLLSSIFTGFLGDGIGSSPDLPKLDAGTHVGAFTLAPSDIVAASIDGATAIAESPATVPTNIEYIGFQFQWGNSGVAGSQYVEKIEIFRTPVAVADLPALSAI